MTSTQIETDANLFMDLAIVRSCECVPPPFVTVFCRVMDRCEVIVVCPVSNINSGNCRVSSARRMCIVIMLMCIVIMLVSSGGQMCLVIREGFVYRFQALVSTNNSKLLSVARFFH